MNENISKKEILHNFIFSDKSEKMKQLETEFLKNPEFQKYFKKEEELYGRLMNSIPTIYKRQMLKYTDALLFILLIQSQFYYLQGLQDCADFETSLFGNDGQSSAC